MSKTHTVSTIPRLTSTSLSKTLLEHAASSTNPSLDQKLAPDHIAIIDVRDDDHIGGHIIHSTHIPSAQLDHKIPQLVRDLKDKKVVVFHCALSQVRGPKAALMYLRARERLLAAGEGGGDGKEKGEAEKQKVYVLERGFVGWQEEFGEDVRLTEGWRKEIWEDGYWM